MEIKAPDLGVEKAEVSEILVAEGDMLAVDDNIVLLESDKASVEVPTTQAGKVTRIAVSVGDSVSEGSVLIEIEASESDNNEPDESETSDSNSLSVAEDKKEQSENSKQTDESNDQAKNEQATPSSKTESQTFALPDLGVDSAQVAEVMVAEGDSVDADDAILLIESDKASVEVPAPAPGKIEKLLIKAGDTVENGQEFIVILTNDVAGSGDRQNEEEAESGEQSVENKEDKQTEPKFQSQSESSKQTARSSQTPQTSNKLTEDEVNAKLTDVYAGPAVRKLSRQLGVDITQVEGSAVNGRIVKEDVFAFVKSAMQGQKNQTSSAVSQGSGLPSLPDMSNVELWGETHTEELTRLQKVSIPQLNYNTYLPQVTQFDLADITDTEALRGELKGEFKQQGIGLTILAFIVKATAYALTQHPKFNSHLSDDNTQLIIRESVNLGIAVATDDGLIVPVIKNAQAKGIKQLAIEIGELAGKARDKKLGTKELQGASFTISSQGNLGGTYFTPLVNWPQVGILGVSEATMQPRWNTDQGEFEPRLMLPLSLSYDHRVINGADAAVFTRYVARLLADPRRMLL